MPFETRHRLFWLSLFTVAMAQLEATVVVYLRELYYPDGFRFPLVILSNRIAAIEIGREAATIVMLLGVAKLYAPKDAWRQFAAFLWAFGLWDILYYAWLWIFLRWPTSLLEWDVLFLIPAPWLGPVSAPILVSLVMMASALAIGSLRDAGLRPIVRRWEWGLVVLAGLGLIAVFVSDAEAVVHGRMPRPFAWPAFGLCLGLGMLCATRAYRRSRPGQPSAAATLLQRDEKL